MSLKEKSPWKTSDHKKGMQQSTVGQMGRGPGGGEQGWNTQGGPMYVYSTQWPLVIAVSAGEYKDCGLSGPPGEHFVPEGPQRK